MKYLLLSDIYSGHSFWLLDLPISSLTKQMCFLQILDVSNLASCVCACLSTVFLSHVTVCPWLIPECILINRITTQGKLCQTGTDSLDKKMLETDKCYLLDCGGEVFVWMGRQSSISERKISISASEVRISSPPSLPLPSENSHMKDRSLSCWGVSAWWEGKADQKGQWYNYLGKLIQR